MRDEELKEAYRKIAGWQTPAEARRTEERILMWLAKREPGTAFRIEWKSAPDSGGRELLFFPKAIKAFPKAEKGAGDDVC